MLLIVITPSNIRTIINTAGFDHAVKNEALRRIPPGEAPGEFDQIELNVPAKTIHLRDTSTVQPSTYSYSVRQDAATVLYQHYKDIFLPEFREQELQAAADRRVASQN